MISCAVLGATGAVGQRFLSLLDKHPDFQATLLAASPRNVGRPYTKAADWMLDTDMPERIAKHAIVGVEDVAESDVRVVFSALPGGAAGEAESMMAAAGKAVFTNARDHRMHDDVPLLIPEVNPDHLALIERQPLAANGGWIVANGNCSGIILTLALAPLERAFGLDDVHVTTLQGLSGAGHPGVSALDITDNVLPYIGGEEDKLETEPQKTLGKMAKHGIEAADFPVHATATRVPVREGHLESVHVRLGKKAHMDDVVHALESFQGPPELHGLPHAPAHPIHVTTAPDRPQPRRDRDAEQGMAITIGRLRLDADRRGLRFIVLGHNTLRGAAGQSVLNAEYAHAVGRL